MTTSFHLPLISHLSVNNWQMLPVKLLPIDNCPSSAVAVQPLRRMDELKIEATEGSAR